MSISSRILLSCFFFFFLLLLMAFLLPWLFKGGSEPDLSISIDFKLQNSLSREVSSSEYVVSLPVGFLGEGSNPSYQIINDGRDVMAALKFDRVPAHAGRDIEIRGQIISPEDVVIVTQLQGCPEPLASECSKKSSEEDDGPRDIAISSTMLRDLKRYYQDMSQVEAGGKEFRLTLADNMDKRAYQPELVLFVKSGEGDWEPSKPGQWLIVRVFESLDISTSSLRFIQGYGLEVAEINLAAEGAE